MVKLIAALPTLALSRVSLLLASFVSHADTPPNLAPPVASRQLPLTTTQVPETVSDGYQVVKVDADQVPFLGREAVGGHESDENTVLLPDIYEVKQTPGKGFGGFATRLIVKGTAIIVEEPLVAVVLPEMVPGQGFRLEDMLLAIEASFDDLTSEEKQEFLQLHDHRFPGEEDQSSLLTIFRSNAFNTGDNQVGLFPKTARINHSCKPNAGNWWSEKKGRRTIHAATDIQKGEEITISYIPLLKTSRDRQARLGQYGFTCDCAACQSAESDKRRLKISDLFDSLDQKLYSASESAVTNERLTSQAESLIDLIETEGLTDYLARAFHLAAVFSQRRGHLGIAKEWAMKELEVHRNAEKDSQEALATLEFINGLSASTGD